MDFFYVHQIGKKTIGIKKGGSFRNHLFKIVVLNINF
jgi:hypothetical protein